MNAYTLYNGKLITDEAIITLDAIVAFQGNSILLKNGETLLLTESLANTLKEYLKDTRQMLESIQQQA